MLSANMMSFVKKIVKTGTEEESERPVEVTKLRQVATGVQDWKGSDRTPRAELERLTTEERSIIERVWQKEEEFEKETKNVCMGGSSLMLRQTSSADQETCRICRKTIGGDEQRRQCDECKQAVCEDCASYSDGSKNAHQQWKCSFCRRRSQRQYRLGLEPPPGAGMHRVPSVRRMTQKMRHLGRERSVTVPELSLDLEETIGLDGGPTKGLKKMGSGSFAEEPERSFSLDDREPPDQRREKNHVHKPRSCLDSRRPVDRQISTECSRDSVKVRGDKRSGPRDFFPERTSHHHQKDLLQQHQFSNSESSMDEFYHEEAEDRQRTNRIRKRSRIQRQKFYVEEPDSDSTLSRPEPLTRGDASPRTFGGSVKTFDKWRWQATSQTADKASPAATSGQNSSDSSDFGDVSGEISPLSDLSGRSERYDRCYVSERLGVISHIKVQKSRIRTTVFNKDPSGNLDSSPSPDEHEIGHSQTDKSLSLEDQEVFSYSTMAMRRSIPSVLVDTVADVGPSTRLYPPNEETHRRHSTGRALPRVPVPENQLGVQPVEKHSTHSLDLPRDETRKPERRASAPERENIQIVVDEVSEIHKAQPKPQLKKVRLHRDAKDARAQTRGFGMRVLGGKSAEDGSLYTIISWVRPGGPAEQKGIHQGDKVVEWGGTFLINKTFEEVSAIIERTGDVVEVVVEQHNTRTGEDPLSSHHQKEPVSPRRKQCPTLSLPPDATSDVEIQPISPTRRKLPKTPDQPSQTSFIGDIGIRIWFDHSQNDLVITLFSARGLRRRTSFGTPPCAFAKLRLLPHSGFGVRETQTADPSTNPEWNKSFIFPSVPTDKLLEKSLEITVWDQSPTGQKILLGGTEISLRKTDFLDCLEWHPLTSNQLPPLTPSSTQKATPSSVSGHEVTVRKPVKQSFDVIHSFSEDRVNHQESDGLSDEVIKSSSVDLTYEYHHVPTDLKFLHPEDAWDRIQQIPTDGASEHISASPGESRSSRSTPSSRKLSVQLTSQDSLPDMYAKPKMSDQGRSASFRINRSCTSDSEKVESRTEQKSKCKAGRARLSRTLSLRTKKDDRSVVIERSKLATNNISSPDLTPENEVPIMTIGPGGIRRGAGQVFAPRMKLDQVETLGEIKLGFLLTKGQLEVEVFCACQLPPSSVGQPPDTYIKTYLKEGERQLQKRKTRVIRSTSSPQYRQTLKYNVSDIQGRHLLVMVWERQKRFDHNQPIGAVEIELGRLDLSRSMTCWYPLYPLPSREIDSVVSP